MELLGIGKKFSVIFFAHGIVRGAGFCRVDKLWKLQKFAVAELDENNPAVAWKNVLKALGRSDGLTIVCGAVPDGMFFTFQSADLSIREQRGAVELELPRHVIQLPAERKMQFAMSPAADDGRVNVGVYIFPAASLNSVAARMSQSSCRADAFIYPFLAAEPDDPILYMPDVEADFACVAGAWSSVNDRDSAVAESQKAWPPIISRICSLPEDPEFDFNAFMPLLVIARMLITGKYERSRSALFVLPEKLRPVRFRGHLTVTMVLLVLLLANGIWSFCRTWGRDYREYNTLIKERQKLKRLIAGHKTKARRVAKEAKEMQRVLGSASGDADVVQKLALLSNVLPANVLVSSIRWSDSSVDIVMQCEDDKLDIPALINPLGYWKIEQLQQRQHGGSAVATIVLKLSPVGSSSEVKK